MAKGTYSDGSSSDLSSMVTWGTGNAAVATITAGGVALGVAPGSTSVTADLGGRSGSASLSVALVTSRFDSPYGVAVDSAGNVYVADTNNNTIRRITSAGVVSTLAGTAGVAGELDGTGSAARFDAPEGLSVDGSGNLYVADANGKTIRKVTPAGVVTTIAGMAGTIGTTDGTGSAARFTTPVDTAMDSSGNLYVTDYGAGTIRKIAPGAVVTTLAGTAGVFGFADGTGAAAQFDRPCYMAVDGAGNIYVGEHRNHVIRKITPAGVVSTLAGMPGTVGSADGPASTARFNKPYAVAFDTNGNLFVTDSGNSTVRKIAPGGAVSTLAGVAGSMDNIDGTGSSARFSFLLDIAVDPGGNIYVADTNNHTIRKITSSGYVTTLAGLPGVKGSSN